MIPGFGIDVTQTDATAVVRVVGELDLATAPHLRERLAGLTNSAIRSVTVDHGLRSPKPSAMKLFEMTGLSAVFAIG